MVAIEVVTGMGKLGDAKVVSQKTTGALPVRRTR